MPHAASGSNDPRHAPPRRLPFGFSLESWGQELRFAARSLRRAPGFSLAVFFTLVLCIGPNTAVLSTLYSLVLKPLPFPDPAQLVTIYNVADRKDGQITRSSAGQYRDFKAHADLFAAMAIVLPQNITLDEQDVPARVENDWVSADFFDTLGVKPVLGRFFTPEEEKPGQNAVLVLSHSYWVSHYRADPAIVGQTFHAGGVVFTIVGVAPESLAALSPPTCFFQPYAPEEIRFSPQARYAGDATLYARLKPGVTPMAALAQLSVLERNFGEQQAPPRVRTFLEQDGIRLAIQPLRAGGAIGPMPSLWLLQGGALLVLLIGGVNVTNLFLARMNARRPELATRVALGAGRMTLLRQAVAESLLLAGAAALGGIGFALGAIRVFNRYLPTIERTAPPVTLDFAVIGMIVAGTFLVALVIGALPLQLLWRTGLQLGAARTSSSGRSSRALSGALVTMQVAIAVILLVGSALLIRSFVKVLAIEPGFDAVHIVNGRIALPVRYSAPAANIDVQRRILAAMRDIPGVQNVAEVFGGYGLRPDVRANPFLIHGDPIATGGNPPLANFYTASPGFFATMGMRLLSGRDFNDADDFTKSPVVVVDQTFAARYFPGRIVIGQELAPGTTAPPDGYKWPRIVGVVTRANLSGLEQRDNAPFIFIPVVASATPGFNLLVRSPRPTGDVLRDMRTKLREIDPGLPLYLTNSLQDGIDDMLRPRRGITLLLGTFAGLALLLAGVGLYGVLAYDVSQRTREIGIRGAIGASRGQIVGLILRQGMWKTGVGLAAGTIGALFLTRYLRSQLFDIGAVDPAAYALALFTLAAVALVACWLPARRAAKVDPVIALHAE